jgi:hypothetical protein
MIIVLVIQVFKINICRMYAGYIYMRHHVGIKLFTKIIWNISLFQTINKHILTYFIQWSTLLQWFKTVILLFKPCTARVVFHNFWSIGCFKPRPNYMYTTRPQLMPIHPPHFLSSSHTREPFLPPTLDNPVESYPRLLCSTLETE